MFSAENRIGRLVEIRLGVFQSNDEIKEFAAACKREMGKALRRQPGKLAVVVTDLRNMRLLSPELFATITELMRGNNVMCERSGQITRKSAVGGMQADRAVRDAGHVERRNFNDVDQLVAYLKEVLTEKEAARAHAFLLEFKDATPNAP